MSIIYVDGKKYSVNSTKNLLEACLSVGLDIPYFCWHPILGSVGSCRQCAVKKYDDNGDNILVMSCITPVVDNLSISIKDEESVKFRKSIIELLMTNHPHDCPVCEEGGQCHLQDMTVMTGHNSRKYRFSKKIYPNQKLGPFISHMMNRCITCYRCVRYYKDYSDGKDFGVFGTHDNIYFGRISNGKLENEFSGNLVEVCPTGVFTDKTYSKYFNRKWDLQYSPSICQKCGLGCNILVGERYGKLCKIENRYNKNINHHFLCDRGRFGHGYVNSNDRPKKILLQKKEKKWVKISINEAKRKISNILLSSDKIIGIGSSRASLESNFALIKLVGIKNFSIGMSISEKSCLLLILKILRYGGIYTPSLSEIEKYDCILILGEDITQTSPRLALSIRQAVKSIGKDIANKNNIPSWNTEAIQNIRQDRKYPLFITSFDKTNLDDVSNWTYFAPIEDQARLGFSIANFIDKKAPKVFNLSNKLQNKVSIISNSLLKSKKPLIISGMHTRSIKILNSAYQIAKSLKLHGKNVGISLMVSSANSIGIGIMGGQSLEKILGNLSAKKKNTLIVLENDIHRQIPNKIINSALKKIQHLIVLDHLHTEIMKYADIILPVSNYIESNGTVINHEIRAQRFFKLYDPSFYNKKINILESWRWLNVISNKKKINLDKIISDLIKNFPILKNIENIAPKSTFRIRGQKLARSPHRYSGRTAMYANVSIHEPRSLQDLDTMFSFSMEGNNNYFYNNQDYIPFTWIPGWNSFQSWNKLQLFRENKIYKKDNSKLFKTTKKNKFEWYKNIPNSFQKEKNKWTIVPYYHLFGSEETTQHSLELKEVLPVPYIMMNIIDAKNLNITSNKKVSFRYLDVKLTLKVCFSQHLQSGLVGIPIGIPGIPLYLLGKKIKNIKNLD